MAALLDATRHRRAWRTAVKVCIHFSRPAPATRNDGCGVLTSIILYAFFGGSITLSFSDLGVLLRARDRAVSKSQDAAPTRQLRLGV